jgi:hypothetical protein
MQKRLYIFSVLAMIIFFAAADSALAQRRPERNRDRDDTVDINDVMEQPLAPGEKLRVFVHYPKVIEHSSLGTCTPTTSDPTDFELTGWHLPAGGITWRLNTATIPASIGSGNAVAALEAAFGTWTSADSGEQFNNGGTTTAKRARRDGTNAVFWGKLGGRSIAVTFVWFSTATNEVTEIDMVFNKRLPWAIFSDTGGECQTSQVAYDLQNIATHEIGHWVGLDDLYDSADVDNTMYGFAAGGELKKRTLATGDVDGALAVAP